VITHLPQLAFSFESYNAINFKRQSAIRKWEMKSSLPFR
jgi:hypothetical protein